jgi:hypothetical protein
MPKFFTRLAPFIMLGIAIVAFIFSMMLVAYLFVFGALLGLALFAASWIRDKFFPTKAVTRPKQGRTIDQDMKK